MIPKKAKGDQVLEVDSKEKQALIWLEEHTNPPVMREEVEYWMWECIRIYCRVSETSNVMVYLNCRNECIGLVARIFP